MKKSVNVSQAEKIDGNYSASEMSHKLRNKMEELKDLPFKKQVTININLKRGPKT